MAEAAIVLVLALAGLAELILRLAAMVLLGVFVLLLAVSIVGLMVLAAMEDWRPEGILTSQLWVLLKKYLETIPV